MSHSKISKNDSKVSFRTNQSHIKRIPVDSQSVYTTNTMNTLSEYKSVHFKSEQLNIARPRSQLGLYGSTVIERQPVGKFSNLFRSKLFSVGVFKNFKSRFSKNELPQRRIENYENVKLKRMLLLFPNANQDMLESSLKMYDNDETLAIRWCLRQLNKQ